jgi:hypothetical protein
MADAFRLLLDELKKQTSLSEKDQQLLKEIKDNALKASGSYGMAHQGHDYANQAKPLGLAPVAPSARTGNPWLEHELNRKEEPTKLTEKDVIPGGGGMGAAMGAIVPVIGGVKMAIEATVGALQKAIGTISGFVEALAPSQVLQFQFALHDLNATIGVALQPFMAVIGQLTRELGQMLLPVMEHLKPIFEEVAGVIKNVAVGQLGVFSAVLQAVVPIIRMLADAM